MANTTHMIMMSDTTKRAATVISNHTTIARNHRHKAVATMETLRKGHTNLPLQLQLAVTVCHDILNPQYHS